MDSQTDFGLLNTQTDPRFGDRKYGRLGTVAKNGCGMIALYNVERAANDQTRFEPYYEARKPIKTNLFGLLGTRPSTIAKNLRKKQFEVERIRIRDAASTPLYDAVIVLYWHFFGAHYVAGIGRGDGTYTLYNEYQKPFPLKLDVYIGELKKRKMHPYRIWGVRFPKKEDK